MPRKLNRRGLVKITTITPTGRRKVRHERGETICKRYVPKYRKPQKKRRDTKTFISRFAVN